MTHYSFKYFLRFAWGIFTGEILLFHNLHLNPEIDLLHKDKRGEQVTKEEIMRIRKITGHYLVKDDSALELYAKFEDKPKHKTRLLNRLTGPSNSLRPEILFCVWLFNIQGFPGDSVKTLPVVQETWVQSLGQEDPLKKGMAIHSSILVCRIP